MHCPRSAYYIPLPIETKTWSGWTVIGPTRKSLAIHWGTYSMGSYEPYLEPRSLLREEVEKAGLAATDFFTLEHGGTWSEDPNEETEFGENNLRVNDF
ncbi:N-acetylphosphatidylethanolamine-hydrolyzing phospholipase D [Aphelenchoides besseyi]|nr:N-acetylphosphatidylethanolamine-hydrolyzing phospholipase D [Aphelenchoides besseyi]